MKRAIALIVLLAGVYIGAPHRRAGAGQVRPSDAQIKEIIQKFAAAESQNKVARSNYAFVQDFDLRTIAANGGVTGEMHKVSEITYDTKGKRIEKIISFPGSTLRGLTVTEDDMRDLAGIQPFALTSDDLPKYRVDYKGTEHIDELNTYVFEIKPIKVQAGERYFQGKVWVDDRDLQIVKAQGQAVPETGEQRFPHFESYRENIDGKYWFPTYVYADDVLKFRNASIHMKMVVKFTKYRKL